MKNKLYKLLASTGYYTYAVLVSAGLALACTGALMLPIWVMLNPPWHLIEKSKATGIVCVLQHKVGEETTKIGRITYMRPVDNGVNSYKAIAALPVGTTVSQERDYFYNMRYHCSSTALTPRYFPSAMEVELVYGPIQRWVDSGYTLVDPQ